MLWRTIVEINDNHFPHLPYVPKYDKDCYLKCQETKGYRGEDFFLPIEIAFFTAYSNNIGFVENIFNTPIIFPAEQ